MKPLFFATPEEFGAWLEEHHESATELLVGFHKKGSGKPSITWPESVEQALRFGWIDGVRRSLGEDSYTIRFTPRKSSSNWSAVNIRRATELAKQGLMHAAGLRAFEQRREEKSRIYSYENAPRTLPPEYEKQFRANRKAWEWFKEQPPFYHRLTTFWVISAKREETRARRLAKLIEDSANGRRVGILETRKK